MIHHQNVNDTYTSYEFRNYLIDIVALIPLLFFITPIFIFIIGSSLKLLELLNYTPLNIIILLLPLVLALSPIFVFSFKLNTLNITAITTILFLFLIFISTFIASILMFHIKENINITNFNIPLLFIIITIMFATCYSMVFYQDIPRRYL